MSNDTWLVVLICAIGTFAMRAVPLIWMRRHYAKQQLKNGMNQMPVWLGVLGPLMIAAMFGVSLVPVRADWVGALATVTGVIATALVWLRTRSLGLPVAIGVGVFGLVTYGLTIFS